MLNLPGALLLSTLATSSLALAADVAGTLQLDFAVERTSRVLNHRYGHLRRRAVSGTEEVTLQNELTYYNVEVTLGTPAQTFNVLIDTGSSDLWVISNENPYCSSSSSSSVSSDSTFDCSTSGTFDSSASSTFNKNNSDFYIKYGDGTVSEGDWATDTFTMGNISIDNMSFGLGSLTNSTIGILGVGYAANEASVAIKNNPYTYRNLPLRLVDSGYINTPAYSLWLNDMNAETGSILFGGVDHAKYTGTLQTVPVLKSSTSKTYSAFLVALTEVSISSGDDSTVTSVLNGSPIQALLDSGTSLSYFPKDIANEIVVTQLQGSYVSSLGYYVQSCNLAGNLTYNFSGVTINVPLSSVLLPLTTDTGRQVYSKGGIPVCIIGILPFSSSFALLGDTFLRNAYVVYDLQNNQIGLAQAKLNATDSDIEVIKSTIPSATQASLYSATSSIAGLSTATYSNRLRTSIVETVSGTIALGSATDATTTATSTAKSAAMAVSAPSPVSMVYLMGFSLFFSAGFFCLFI